LLAFIKQCQLGAPAPFSFSLKANRMKSDATFAELATMVESAKLLGLLP
jgi:hypothetical protein